MILITAALFSVLAHGSLDFSGILVPQRIGFIVLRQVLFKSCDYVFVLGTSGEVGVLHWVGGMIIEFFRAIGLPAMPNVAVAAIGERMILEIVSR